MLLRSGKRVNKQIINKNRKVVTIKVNNYLLISNKFLYYAKD